MGTKAMTLVIYHAGELMKAATAAYYDRAGAAQHKQTLRHHLRSINEIIEEAMR